MSRRQKQLSIASDRAIELYHRLVHGKIIRLTRKIVMISHLSSVGSLKLTQTILVNAMNTKIFRACCKRLPKDHPLSSYFDLFPKILPEIAVSISGQRNQKMNDA